MPYDDPQLGVVSVVAIFILAIFATISLEEPNPPK